MVEVAEFNQWLQKGLGRAVVYLNTHDPGPYRDAVLYACTHDLTYDSSERDREMYMRDLIRSAGNEEFLRKGLLEAITTKPEDPDKFDLGQTIESARNFAEKGDPEIRQAMYDAVVRAGFEHEGHCYSDLIKLDGLDALLFAAEHFPTAIEDDDLWQVDILITALQDRDGVEAANAAIQRAKEESPHLAQMLERNRKALLASEHPGEDEVRPDYATLKRMGAEKPSPIFYANWGRTASEQELQAAAADVIAEQDETRLLAYLRIFWFQRFPAPTDRLFELAQSSNISLARHAVAVLSRLTSPEIRDLALRFLNAPGRRGDAVKLLMDNYQPGDFQRIETRLRKPMDVDELHSVGFGVQHLVEVYRCPEAEHSLLLLYEKGPCSMCRGGFVEALIALSRLPEWMRAECRYDSDTETRKLVQ